MEKKRIYQAGVGSGREFHKAKWILVNPDTILENACLEIENGLIRDIHQNLMGQNVIDHGSGVIMPALVNAHLHLELSALKGCLSFEKGFKDWVGQLLAKREALSRDEMIKGIKKAGASLLNSGVSCVGDIASLDVVSPIASGLGLNGVFFQEYLGTSLPDFESVENISDQNPGLSFSLAGHAPHTTSPKLLKTLKTHTDRHGLVFSIHAAESDDETEFISSRKGVWADFLTMRGIDWNTWDINATTPVEHLFKLRLLGARTLAVHLLNVIDDDIRILADTGTKVCLCPRSNENLHNKLPDIAKMIDAGIEPALGTDSLASCESLDIFEEMAFVGKRYPGLDPSIILAMGTINGARALCMDGMFGSLEKGKCSDFIYSPVEADNGKALVEKIILDEY